MDKEETSQTICEEALLEDSLRELIDNTIYQEPIEGELTPLEKLDQLSRLFKELIPSDSPAVANNFLDVKLGYKSNDNSGVVANEIINIFKIFMSLRYYIANPNEHYPKEGFKIGFLHQYKTNCSLEFLERRVIPGVKHIWHNLNPNMLKSKI